LPPTFVDANPLFSGMDVEAGEALRRFRLRHAVDLLE
jgi:DNA-directed RNA polymerase alpha subunit